MFVPQVHVKMVEHVMIKSTHSGAHVVEAGVEVLVKQVSWQGRAVQQSMAYPLYLIKNSKMICTRLFFHLSIPRTVFTYTYSQTSFLRSSLLQKPHSEV